MTTLNYTIYLYLSGSLVAIYVECNEDKHFHNHKSELLNFKSGYHGFIKTIFTTCDIFLTRLIIIF